MAITTATACRRLPLSPAAREFTLGGSVLKQIGRGARPAQTLVAASGGRAQAETRQSRRCRRCLDMANNPSPHTETNCHILKSLAIYGKYSKVPTLRYALMQRKCPWSLH